MESDGLFMMAYFNYTYLGQSDVAFGYPFPGHPVVVARHIALGFAVGIIMCMTRWPGWFLAAFTAGFILKELLFDLPAAHWRGVVIADSIFDIWTTVIPAVITWLLVMTWRHERND